MVGDAFKDRWGDKFPPDWGQAPVIPTIPSQPFPFDPGREWIAPQPGKLPDMSQLAKCCSCDWDSFNALKREVELMKELLIRAVQYDKDNDEPHCETDEKIAFLKRVAEWVGIDLNDVFGK